MCYNELEYLRRIFKISVFTFFVSRFFVINLISQNPMNIPIAAFSKGETARLLEMRNTKIRRAIS